MSFLLKAENISKRYDRDILKNLSLNIQKGEFVSIFGKSGSGKSTLLYILSGMLRPDKGKLHFNSKNVYKNPTKYRKENVGFVFQFFHLINSLTVYENLCLPLRILNRRADESKIVSLLSDLGIYEIKNSYPQSLSGGEKQRIAFARAILKKPEILFCDEPTGNLDEENSAFIFDAIKKFNLSGGTVVLVTHDRDLLFGSVYKLESGQLNRVGKV